MRNIFLLASIFMTIGCLDDNLVQLKDCGKDCAITSFGNVVKDPDNLEGYGCNLGKISCETGEEVCEGYIPYSEERCDPNGVDENCDGIGNNINLNYYDYRNDCSGEGVCEYSIKSCTMTGDWICIPPDSYGQEVCDGLDNDCDGLVDSSDPDIVLTGFSYSGPPETLNVGECRAGVLRCIEGELDYFGEVVPTEELCGNGDDDDCDGFTDEPSTPGNMSLLLVIDFSGSMDVYISYVIDAVCLIAEDPDFDQFMIGIQAVADDSATFPHISTVSPFTNPTEACIALANYHSNLVSASGLEFVGEAIIMSNQLDSEVYLEWPAGLDRNVIFFTDEDPQDVWGSIPDLNNQIAVDCSNYEYDLGGFVSYAAPWRDFVDGCGGWLESLSVNPELMMSLLQDRFLGRC